MKKIIAVLTLIFLIPTTTHAIAYYFDDVNVNEDHVFNFIWEEEDHKAKMVAHRTNSYAKFEWLPKTEEDEEDPQFFEIRLEMNELTQSTYIRITDYTDFDDNEELNDLWEGLVYSLKEVVGG